jgi:hypothetical protein
MLLSDCRHIFSSAQADGALFKPLRVLAMGLRALPPLRHVGIQPVDVDDFVLGGAIIGLLDL